MEKFRINNIEYRNINTKEIVHWLPNEYYGKESNYEWTDDKEYAIDKKCDYHKIHKDCFKNPEYCYVLAFVRDNINTNKNNVIKIGNVFLEMVGNRVAELSENDFKDFIRICQIFYNK